MPFYLKSRFKHLKVCTLVSSLCFLYGNAYAIESSSSPVIAPVSIASTGSAPLNAVSQIPVLPNAYELVKRLDAQQREMSRLAREVESLQFEVETLKRDAEDPLAESTALALRDTLEPYIQTEIKKQVKSELALRRNNLSTQPPYLTPPKRNDNQTALNDDSSTKQPILLSNTNIANSEESLLKSVEDKQELKSNKSNPLTQASNEKQGQLAYAAAYSALKNEGAESGIHEMKKFIASYPNHSLIPNAHYWLGEFYLKASPPNVKLAKAQFLQVINDYKDYPSNDKQSKALYRLATFAKNERQASLAKRYVEQLQNSYPKSNEAKLAKTIKW